MFLRQDKEIEQYRDLVEVPETFERGFGLKMVVAAVFLGFLMVPGSIYLTLFMGQGLGPAAQWVTVILFAEVAKRSMKSLRRQEVYLLFYMTGIALGGQMFGGTLNMLLWNQYLVQSPAASGLGIAPQIPDWVAPQPDVIRQYGRSFFNDAWAKPVALIAGMLILQRIDSFGLGYALYRITCDIEKLPFPMAPVGTLGITAMAESRKDKSRWHWRWFSIGGVMGMGFGFIYIGVPALTHALFNTSVQIIPIPWLDLTAAISSESFMPAVPFNIVFDLTFIIVGMVLPFWAVVGGFLGLVVTWILNPMLYGAGMLPSWKEGMKVVDTTYHNSVDFWLSFSIGLTLAIFVISLLPVITSLFGLLRSRSTPAQEPTEQRTLWRKFLFTRNRERGDISVIISLGIYVFSSLAYISVCLWLMPGTAENNYKDQFPWHFFLGYSFLYMPIISYVNAKLEGLVGQTINPPLVREASFILSGYEGAAIWFAPIPATDYGSATRQFRIMELTGTRLTDVIKVELLAIPIMLVASFIFCQMIWGLAPIPSEAYPFTQEVWDLQARSFCLTVTATTEGSSEFMEALKFDVITYGAVVGVGAFLTLSFLGLPTLLVYGLVRGLGQIPGVVIVELTGALLGRFWLQRKYGHQQYKRYVSILAAGFMAGVGLISMASVATALIAKSTTTLGY